MTAIGKKALTKYYLDGQEVNAPIDWQSINVLATFDNESTQANISSSQFTFTLSERAKINNYINAGLTGGVGIFEGMPFSIRTYNNINNEVAFDGFLDLTNNFQDK
jgi:hypothetical protein